MKHIGESMMEFLEDYKSYFEHIDKINSKLDSKFKLKDMVQLVHMDHTVAEVVAVSTVVTINDGPTVTYVLENETGQLLARENDIIRLRDYKTWQL